MKIVTLSCSFFSSVVKFNRYPIIKTKSIHNDIHMYIESNKQILICTVWVLICMFLVCLFSFNCYYARGCCCNWYAIPGWPLIKSIVSSGFQLFGLIFIVASVALIQRRIQIEHFVWLGFLRNGHLTNAHDNFPATFEYRIQCLVHQNGDGSLWLLRICWCCVLLKFWVWFLFYFIFFSDFYIEFILLLPVELDDRCCLME